MNTLNQVIYRVVIGGAFLIRLVGPRFRIIGRFLSQATQSFKISHGKRRAPRHPISRSLQFAGVGLITVVFAAAGYGTREEESVMHDEQLAQAPNTLDLVERARYAINAMTRSTNPKAEYAVYFTGVLHRNPPTLLRAIPLYGKFMEGLALLRIMTSGDFDTRPSSQPKSFNQHVDIIWREALLRKLREQELTLVGAEGGRQLAWLAIQYRQTKDAIWKELGDAVIQRALETTVHQDDYCYFPQDSEGTMPSRWGATYQGWTLQGVTQYYIATGSEAALELAGKLARYLKDHSGIFDSNGRFLARHDVDVPLNPPSTLGPALHFHHNGNAMEAISAYAWASGEVEFAQFAKKCYEYARSLPDSSPLVGFFQEYIDDWPDNRGVIDCETCCVVDMMLTALWMTKAGVGDYWDDIDRYLRNQFAEMQMTSGDWLIRMTEGLPYRSPGEGEIAMGSPDRWVGTFAGWATANDFFAIGAGPGIMHCCTGNGSRALYYLWENMLEYNDSELKLHLLLNRKSPSVEVSSRIPYEGSVDLKVKARCDNVTVRAPEWVESSSRGLSCQVNGVSRQYSWEGRYVHIGEADPGDIVDLAFPISERAVEETVGGVPYTLVIRGNNVISISPPGRNYPFYNR